MGSILSKLKTFAPVLYVAGNAQTISRMSARIDGEYVLASEAEEHRTIAVEGKRQWDKVAAWLGVNGDDVDAVFVKAKNTVGEAIHYRSLKKRLDEIGAALGFRRDEHYDAVDEIRILKARIASLDKELAAWDEKTQWVQETADHTEFGKHRADVLNARLTMLAYLDWRTAARAILPRLNPNAGKAAGAECAAPKGGYVVISTPRRQGKSFFKNWFADDPRAEWLHGEANAKAHEPREHNTGWPTGAPASPYDALVEQMKAGFFRSARNEWIDPRVNVKAVLTKAAGLNYCFVSGDVDAIKTDRRYAVVPTPVKDEDVELACNSYYRYQQNMRPGSTVIVPSHRAMRRALEDVRDAKAGAL